MHFQLTSNKKHSSVVGLDIEAGSIAATEVKVNGAVEIVGSAVGPLDPGAFQEGEVLDADLLAEALKSLFAQNKLSKQVRLGVGNQRLVVRTLRLPAIEDPKEMDRGDPSSRPRSRCRCRSTRRSSSTRSSAASPAEEGAAPQVDVVVVAARRDMISSFVSRSAGPASSRSGSTSRCSG